MKSKLNNYSERQLRAKAPYKNEEREIFRDYGNKYSERSFDLVPLGAIAMLHINHKDPSGE